MGLLEASSTRAMSYTFGPLLACYRFAIFTVLRFCRCGIRGEDPLLSTPPNQLSVLEPVCSAPYFGKLRNPRRKSRFHFV